MSAHHGDYRRRPRRQCNRRKDPPVGAGRHTRPLARSTEYRLASLALRRRASPRGDRCRRTSVAAPCASGEHLMRRADLWQRVALPDGTSPSKCPSADAFWRISTPAARARVVSARPGHAHPPIAADHPARGPSSTSTTSAPWPAAAIARRDQPGRPRSPAGPRAGADSRSARCARPASPVGARGPLRCATPSHRAAIACETDERLVVEARRREGPAELVGDRHRSNSRPGLAFWCSTIAPALTGSMHAGSPAHRRRSPGSWGTLRQHMRPRRCIFEATREGPPSGGDSASDRVTRVGLTSLPSKLKLRVLERSISSAGWACGGSSHHLRRGPVDQLRQRPGSPTRSTRFDRVSRSAWNQVRSRSVYHHRAPIRRRCGGSSYRPTAPQRRRLRRPRAELAAKREVSHLAVTAVRACEYERH